MTQNQMFMSKAKEKLSNMWVSAALATLIVYALLGVAGCTYIGELIVTGPLCVGYAMFIIALTGYKKADYNTLFEGFKNFGQTLIAGLLISIFVSIGTALLIVPGVILSLGFAMTYFIMVDDPQISGIDAIQASWNLMKGHKWELFCLYCRFIGWGLLGLLTCGILYLWLAPYMTAATLNFYRNLRYGNY
ncbi:MAG: DUF975 family protein [Muribaculaceae bacterium]|nr:DUF975 family protein [Muribaculaceae bacterium]